MFPAGEPAYRVTFLTLRSGERVRVIETGPVAGHPVVCVGGWACSAWDFHRTLPALAAAGYRALAIDLRGQGLSDKPSDGALYDTSALVDHVREVLDVLQLGCPALVGHSMGGAIALHLTMRDVERCRGTALISPVGFGDIPIARLGRILSPPWSPIQWFVRRGLIGVALRVLYTNRECVTPRNIDEYWAPTQFSTFVPAQRATLHRFRWTPFTDAELAVVRTPALIIRGVRDPVVRVPSAPRKLPPVFQELTIAGAGHLPHDEAPDVAHAALIDFLARHFGASPTTG
jgi:pimeloyl-ACP methyl ester carboxylesterase